MLANNIRGNIMKDISNQMLCVTCTYNKCRPYREMLTYKPLTNNAVQEKELR